ncbi:hypothetical protein ymoll0001_33940 [Yersinia mollaretii ATCC 43969]|uniref:Uncharacterized protein n=1 Tax=Yersinia mollaretii (strain ATCC 43969 / DSM 18520 / CIP 103324 / CNY 7263 / WAIP 204) TaxID=349967 RepID=A0ABM9YBG3_YERMW|nr:hypothetical protein ymoll0001_33940 [Yersinia mollaretii ATCC 43969]
MCISLAYKLSCFSPVTDSVSLVVIIILISLIGIYHVREAIKFESVYRRR